jgi:hypothetical protein
VSEPPNKYAQRGLDLHDVAEQFLKRGTMPPETEAGQVFRAGLPFLPTPGRGTCEGAFEFFPENEPFSFVGRIDWHGTFLDGGIYTLLDHKSTSSQTFEWTKDEATLRTDVQAMLYAAYLMQAKDLDVLRGRWLSYRWTPERPKAVPVDFTVDLPHVVEQFEKIKEIAREMAFRRGQHVKAEELPYDATSCGVFGGCPYQDRCALTGAERLRAHMAGQMSLKEKMALRAQQQPQVNPGATSPSAPAAPALVQATLPTVVAASVSSLSAKMRAKKARLEFPPADTQASPEGAPLSAKAPVQVPVSPAPAVPALGHPGASPTAAEVKAAVTVADMQAAVVYLSKDKCEDLALGLEMAAAGLKAIAKHFRSVA